MINTLLKKGLSIVGYHHLTRSERGCIALMWNNGSSKAEIARELGHHRSTISRELGRNTQPNGRYRAEPAQRQADRRRMDGGRPAMAHKPELLAYVQQKLILCWSPEQIHGRLPLDYPDDPRMRVSFSSIYRWLDRGLLPMAADLKLNLRHREHAHTDHRGLKVNGRDIRKRAKEALRRKRLGDWEVDTLVFGAQPHRTHLLNIVDRKSRYCCLALLKNTKKDNLIRAFSFFFGNGELPLLTMTADRGHEFSCHHEFEQAFAAPFYFTRPASPWQKPSVENTNGLIRQFFPRALDVHELSDSAVASVMFALNNRPRKCLRWFTPAESIRLP